jgi:hypothetical protein
MAQGSRRKELEVISNLKFEISNFQHPFTLRHAPCACLLYNQKKKLKIAKYCHSLNKGNLCQNR